MTKKLQVISPVDDSVYAERNYASGHEISDALQKAKAAQLCWRKTGIADRATICLQMVDNILAMKQDIAEEICWQMGRPIRYCEGEVNGFAERARYMIDIAERKLASIDCNDKTGFNRFIQRDPLGTVFSVVPWNYPYLTAVNSIVPAIMAGNTVIMKPASQTPLTAERLAKAFIDTGLPEGVFQFLFLDHEQTEALIQDPAIDFVCFTGSVNGGLQITEAAKQRFIGVGLELGGKDPAYVRADADMSYSVETLVDGAFFNSGQSCCGIERIYVHEALYDEFVQKFVDLVNQYNLGDPSNSDTTLGPMVNARGADRVRKQIEAAVSQGAKPLIDVSRFAAAKNEGPWLAPQVLVDVDHTMSVMRDESFGPVVGIMKVASDDEAIRLMNDNEYGLTASVWTRDEQAATEIGQQIQTGTVFMNRCDYLDPALAWTGVKKTGRGCTLSEIGYEQLTRPKSFHLKRLC